MTQMPRICWRSFLFLFPIHLQELLNEGDPKWKVSSFPAFQNRTAQSTRDMDCHEHLCMYGCKYAHMSRYVWVCRCTCAYRSITCVCLYRHTTHTDTSSESSSPVLSTKHVLSASSKTAQQLPVQNFSRDCCFIHMVLHCIVSSLGGLEVLLRETPVSSLRPRIVCFS